MVQATYPRHPGSSMRGDVPDATFGETRFDRSERPTDETVVIIVEPIGLRWWVMHRNDGKSGGFFDDRASALRYAEREARKLIDARIEVREPGLH